MTTPQAQADRLVDALNQNTHALKSVKRRYRWSLFMTALLALTLVFVVYSNHESDIDSCRNNNAVRSDIDNKFGSIADFLDEAISDTPENREFIQIVRSNLQRRNCSDIGWIKE